MTATDIGQQFVEFVVKALVDYPDDVRTEGTVDEMGVLITLYTHPEDMGKVIGRSGNTAKALRTLLRVVGAKHKARVNLKIFEPEGGQRRPFGGGGYQSQQQQSDSNQGQQPQASGAATSEEDDFNI
jgi:predicted RNA-binding protein YlqC (UPF0109 family)